MPSVRAVLFACLTLPLLLAGTAVHASQQLGHMFVALTAAEGAPEALRSILLANVDSYVAGATGPDIALISFRWRRSSGSVIPVTGRTTTGPAPSP